MSKNFIYGLVHPNTRELRYVGLSSRGMETPRRHKHVKSGGTHKNNWVNSLKSEDLMYDIVVLLDLGPDATPEQLKREEVRIIAEERTKGTRLVNETNGGDGTFGYKQSEEQKAKQAAFMVKKQAEQGSTPKMLETCHKAKPHVFVDGVELKECNKCDQHLTLDQFGKYSAAPDGLNHYCKSCRNKDRKKYAYVKMTPEERAVAEEKRAESIRRSKKEKPQENYATKAIACFKDGVHVRTFVSSMEAVRLGYGKNPSRISAVSNTHKEYNGYTWKHV